MGEYIVTLMDASADTNKLVKRINENKESQSFSLNEWIFSDLTLDGFSKIFELCSGTGEQSECFVNLISSDTTITLSDISGDACDLLKKKFVKFDNVKIVNKEMDDLLDTLNEQFDMIFVSYGLYYSQYSEDILCKKIARLLKPRGKFVVVGPYIGNNNELFGFLASLGVKVPKAVIYCCDNFMQNILLEMNKLSSDVRLRFVENKQQWRSLESLLSYWQNSTFYDSRNEELVKTSLKSFFEKNKCFQITKKIAKFEFTIGM